jgi:hypothetical protein
MRKAALNFSRICLAGWHYDVFLVLKGGSKELPFSPDRLHNRPEAARYLLNLVTASSDRDKHTLSKFS